MCAIAEKEIRFDLCAREPEQQFSRVHADPSQIPSNAIGCVESDLQVKFEYACLFSYSTAAAVFMSSSIVVPKPSGMEACPKRKAKEW